MNTAVQVNYAWSAKDDLSDEDAVTVDQDSLRSSERENDRRLDTSQNTVSMYNEKLKGRSFAFGQDLTSAAGGRVDSRLPPRADDPRVKVSRAPGDDSKRVRAKGKGRNTESFDPKSTIVRPGAVVQA